MTTDALAGIGILAIAYVVWRLVWKLVLPGD